MASPKIKIKWVLDCVYATLYFRPSMQTSVIELVCAGYYTQCYVIWYEVLINHETNKIGIVNHTCPVKQKHRDKSRINYVKFSVPEDVICSYSRYVRVKPQTFENRWFKMTKGQFVDLGEFNGELTYADLYLSDYKKKGYRFSYLSCGDAGIVNRWIENGFGSLSQPEI